LVGQGVGSTGAAVGVGGSGFPLSGAAVGVQKLGEFGLPAWQLGSEGESVAPPPWSGRGVRVGSGVGDSVLAA